MKSFVVLTACAMIVAAPMQVLAQTDGQSQAEPQMKKIDHKIDLSTVLCKELPAMPAVQVEQLVTWLQGFYTLENAPRVFNPDKIKADITKLGAYCKENPEANLVAAGDDVIYEEEPKAAQPK